MRYISFCSGVEAASLAWMPLGWEAVAFSEIEPFPCAVLAERFPNVPNLGDCRKIHYNQESQELYVKEEDGTISRTVKSGKIDLTVGGFPCQSFSVAGQRTGLDGASGLVLEYFRLLSEIRPDWVVYENVPGMLSSNHGRDFRLLVRKFTECGYGIAWRVLDAQYVRVDGFPRAIPQRRRRVFVVGCLGDWQRAAEVLFESEGVSGNTPPRRTKRQAVAAGTQSGTVTAESIRNSRELSLTLAMGNDKTVITHPDVECLDMRQVEVHDTGIAPTLIATDYKGGKAVSFYPYQQKECSLEECSNTLINGDCPGHQNAVAVITKSDENKDTVVCFENHGNDSRVTESKGISPTITSSSGTGGNNLPLVMTADDPIGFIRNDAGGERQGFWNGVFPTVRSHVIPAVAYNVSFCDANGTRKDRPDGGLYVTEAETSKTVTAGGTNAETVIIDPVALDGDKMAKAERKGGSGLGVNTDGAMYTQTVKDVHAVAVRTANTHANGIGCTEENAYTLDEANGQAVNLNATVRRLLPVETERLMGMPDNWTRIPWKGKPAEECPDSPRYKACGNSMCVNCMRWLGMRIELNERRHKND